MDHVITMNGENPPQKLHSPQGGMICSLASRGTRQPMLQHALSTLQPPGNFDATSSDVT